jgi:excinuclease UvrABC ATPase subunit
VAQGTPKNIAMNKTSYTGRYLKRAWQVFIYS